MNKRYINNIKTKTDYKLKTKCNSFIIICLLFVKDFKNSHH